uniref:Uncharacterized protein n=1 Tax=Entomoneis paludosa TaxID=265537 RepID=A0A6U3ALL2_9STRA
MIDDDDEYDLRSLEDISQNDARPAGDTNSLVASSQAKSNQNQEGSVAMPAASNKTGHEVIVAIEDGIERLCAYPLPRMFPKEESNRPPSSISLPAGDVSEMTDRDGTLNGESIVNEREEANLDSVTRSFKNHGKDETGSLIMSDSDVDPVLGPVMNFSSSYSKTKTVLSADDSNLLFALTRSDLGSEGTSTVSSTARRMDGSSTSASDSSNSDREKQELFSRVERVRALLEGTSQSHIESGLSSPPSLQSSAEPVPGDIALQNKLISRSPRLQSVLERLRHRRDLKQGRVGLEDASPAVGRTVDRPADPDDLFTRYDSIVKQMIVSDKERLGLAQERQATKDVIDVSGASAEEHYASLLDDESSSMPSSIRSRMSNPSQRSEQGSHGFASKMKNVRSFNSTETTTPSQKARDLRKQLDQALKTSVAIRSTQETLNTDMTTFKEKLQNKRLAALHEVEALAANISPRGSRSPISPRSPRRTFSQPRQINPIASLGSSDPEESDFYNEGEVTSGSEEDEDDVRLQQLDSIIHGLRDAQRRQTGDESTGK